MLWVAWGITREKDYGPAYPLQCSNCKNETYHRLLRSIRLGLFFIIPIPYKWNYYLYCPVCDYGIKLSRHERKAVKDLISPTEAFMEGQISEEAYLSQVEELDVVLGSSG